MTTASGGAVIGPTLVGNTFAVDLFAGTWVHPPNAGNTLFANVDGNVLLGVTAQTPTTLSTLLANPDANGVSQDLCTPTTDMAANQPGVWTNPNFSVGPAELTREAAIPPFGIFPLALLDLEFSGTFVDSSGSGADSVVQGSVSGHMDLRRIGLGDCASAAVLVGGQCEPCPNAPTEIECFNFWIQDVTGTLVPGLSLVPWTASDVSSQSGC